MPSAVSIAYAAVSIDDTHNLHLNYCTGRKRYLLWGLVRGGDIGFRWFDTRWQAEHAAEELVPWVNFRLPDPVNDQ